MNSASGTPVASDDDSLIDLELLSQSDDCGTGDNKSLIEWCAQRMPEDPDSEDERTRGQINSLLDALLLQEKHNNSEKQERHKLDSRTFVRPRRRAGRPGLNTMLGQESPPSFTSPSSGGLTYNKYSSPLPLHLLHARHALNTTHNITQTISPSTALLAQNGAGPDDDVGLRPPSKPIDIDLSQPASNLHATFNRYSEAGRDSLSSMLRSGGSFLNASPPSLVNSLLDEQIECKRDSNEHETKRHSDQEMVASMTLSIMDDHDMSTSFLSHSTVADNSESLLGSLPPSLPSSVDSSWRPLTPGGRLTARPRADLFTPPSLHATYNTFTRDHSWASPGGDRDKSDDDMKTKNSDMERTINLGRPSVLAALHAGRTSGPGGMAGALATLSATKTSARTSDQRELSEIVQARQKLSLARSALSPDAALANRSLIETPRRDATFKKRSPRSLEPPRYLQPSAPTAERRSPTLDVPSPIQNRSPIMENRSDIVDNRSPVADDRSPIADKRSPVVDKLSSIMDNRSPVRDTRSPIRDMRPPIMDSRSPLSYARSPKVDIRDLSVDVRPPKVDSRPPSDEPSPEARTVVCQQEDELVYLDGDSSPEHHSSDRTSHPDTWGQRCAMGGSSDSADTATLSSGSPPEPPRRVSPRNQLAEVPAQPPADTQRSASPRLRRTLLGSQVASTPLAATGGRQLHLNHISPITPADNNKNNNTVVMATNQPNNITATISSNLRPRAVPAKSPVKSPISPSAPVAPAGPLAAAARRSGLPTSKLRQYSSHRELNRLPGAPTRAVGGGMERRAVYASNPALSPTAPTAPSSALARRDSYVISTDVPPLVRQGTETLRRPSQTVAPPHRAASESAAPRKALGGAPVPPLAQTRVRPVASATRPVPTSTQPTSRLPGPRSRLPAPRRTLRPPSSYSVAPNDNHQY